MKEWFGRWTSTVPVKDCYWTFLSYRVLFCHGTDKCTEIILFFLYCSCGLDCALMIKWSWCISTASCGSTEDFENLCLAADSAEQEHTLIRTDGLTTCPFTGERAFTYQHFYSQCIHQPPSKLMSRSNDTQLVFVYNPCLEEGTQGSSSYCKLLITLFAFTFEQCAGFLLLVGHVKWFLNANIAYPGPTEAQW